MHCTQIRERLLAWQYGDLSPVEQAEVTRHLATCAACREESSAWQEFRGQLGAFTGPAVQVNLSGVYQAAVQRHEQRVGRWRRSAIAIAAVAAVVLIAVGLKLEVRVDASQVVVRWGAPAEILPSMSEPPGPVVIQTQPVAPQVTGEDLALVKNLIRALAQDVRTRDRQQQEALLQMQSRFETLLGRTTEYVAANERDKAALYLTQVRMQKKGDKQ